MEKLYYIDSTTIPAENAHSIQIKTNVENLSKLIDTTLISYGEKTKDTQYSQIKFSRPKIFNKIIPLSTFHILFKILRNVKFEKESVLFTRSPLIGFVLRKKFKKVLIEIHDIPKFKHNPFNYLLFDLILYDFPMFFLKKKENIEIVVISSGLKKDLIKKGFNKNNIFVLHDGVDLEKFDIELSKKDARQKLNLPQNKKVVLYVGSLHKWKGVDTLLEASKLIKNKSISFYVIGGSNNEIEKLKKDYQNVNFLGYKKNDQIPYYLKAADILTIPNSGKYEISVKYTSPLKLFEYMASNRPILASDLPSIRDVVSSKQAYFFEPDNSISLSKEIQNILNDKKGSLIKSKNANKLSKDYSWDIRAKKIIKITNEK